MKTIQITKYGKILCVQAAAQEMYSIPIFETGKCIPVLVIWKKKIIQRTISINIKQIPIWPELPFRTVICRAEASWRTSIASRFTCNNFIATKCQEHLTIYYQTKAGKINKLLPNKPQHLLPVGQWHRCSRNHHLHARRIFQVPSPVTGTQKQKQFNTDSTL